MGFRPVLRTLPAELLECVGVGEGRWLGEGEWKGGEC